METDESKELLSINWSGPSSEEVDYRLWDESKSLLAICSTGLLSRMQLKKQNSKKTSSPIKNEPYI